MRDLWRRDSLRVEASSKCQLRCPACPTGRGLNREGAVGWGNIRLKNFRKLLDENPGRRRFELSSWGEVLLNPEFPDLLKCAAERGVEVAVSGVNFNAADDRVLEAMVVHGLTRLQVAIDGATEESYQKYRHGGSLTKVLAHVRRLNEFKKQYRSSRPRLVWQFIVFGHNQHEVAQAREMARDLGMEFQLKLQNDHWASGPYSPVAASDALREETGLPADRETYLKERGREFILPCLQLWTESQVNWDGKLLGCCDNVWNDFGSVFDEGLETCLNKESYRYAQRMLLGDVPGRSDIPCTSCHHYRRRSLATLLESLGWAGGFLRWILRLASGRCGSPE